MSLGRWVGRGEAGAEWWLPGAILPICDEVVGGSMVQIPQGRAMTSSSM